MVESISGVQNITTSIKHTGDTLKELVLSPIHRYQDFINTLPNGSRREFIRNTGNLGFGLMFVPSFLTKPFTVNTSPPEQEDLPRDILTLEELAKANIVINQTENTQLFLRRSALDIPVFKDSLDGKIGGVTISLIDGQNVSWDAVKSIPDEASTVFYANNIDPQDYTDSDWEDLEKEFSNRFSLNQSLYYQMQMEKGGLNEGGHSSDTNDQKASQERLKQLYDELPRIATQLDYERGILETIKAGGKTKIDYFRKNYGPQGQFIYTVDKAFEDHPERLEKIPTELRNKVYIYVVVGGQYEPNPSMSFPSPNRFTVRNNPNKTDYDIEPHGAYSTAILEHESGHYNGPNKATNNEYYADHNGFNRTMKGWVELKKTGDDSVYPFIFKNKNGLTIGEKQPDPTGSSV